MTTKTPPVLNEHDLNSQTWMKLKAHFEDRLDGHRRRNDADQTHDQTTKRRGRIAEAKYFLSLGTPETESGSD